MIKLAANLSALFGEVPFLERFEMAAKSGFKGVEYLFPYDYPAEQLKELLETNGLEQVLFDFPSGDWENNERGIAGLPGRVREFREGVGKAVEYAEALGCKRLTLLAGRVPSKLDLETYEQTLLDNVKYAARAAREVDATVLVEPLNLIDIPNFLIGTTSHAAEIVKMASQPNVKMQYDIYHMQRQEGNVCEVIEAHKDMIHHFQIADNPGRGEPGTGEINYDFVLDFIDRLGYDGWIGCEYNPKGDTVAGLQWAKKWLS